MERNSGIYRILTASILTFSGLLSLIMSFCGPFYDKFGYSTAAIVVFSAVFSILFSAFFNIVKKKWLVWAGFLLLFGVFFLIYREEIIGGVGSLINEVINETSGYFDAEMWYIDIPKRFLRQRDEAMALYCLVIVIAAVYAFCMSTPRLALIPWTASLFLFVYPLVLEKYSKGFWVLFGIAYLMVTMIVALSGMRKKATAAYMLPVQLAAIALGAIICFSGIAVLNIKPEKEFARSEYFATVYDKGKELYDRYQNGELAINRLEDFFIALNPFAKPAVGDGSGGSEPGPSASGSASKLGAGELGQVDELVFSGKDVLEVTMPSVGGKVYVKGFIGAVYAGNRWLEPIDPGLPDIHSQLLTSEYLGMLWYDMPIEAYRTEMTVKYVAENRDFQFVPLYPLKSDAIGAACKGDAGFNDLNEDLSINFIDFNQNQLRNIDAAYSTWQEIPEEVAQFVARESEYRQYAYDNYLDVNTTVADQLYGEWGGSSIDGAAQRYEVACRIRNYLAENCKYTTKPGKVPEGRDFVEYFLNETNEGYCTYFATSAVMMLRSAGIPARYVEGYSFRMLDTANTVKEALYDEYDGSGVMTTSTRTCKVKRIPDSAAHAWVEYYVDGVGWVDFEVTPGNYTEPNEHETTEPQTTKQPQTTANENRTTASGDKPTTTASDKTTAAENGGGFRFKIKLSKKAERILICAAVFAAAAFAFVMLLKYRHRKAEAVYERICNISDGEPADWCILTMYADYLRMLKHFGCVRREYETEADFAARAAKSCAFVAESEALRMAELYEKAVFDGEDVTSEHSEEHRKLHMSVRERMYGGVGIIKRLLLKYIYNL